MSTLIRSLTFVSSLFAGTLAAQALPVSVTVTGQTAMVRVGTPASPIADLRLDFDDATGLTPAALGVSAERIDVTSPALLARLPTGGAVSVPAELPIVITIEPSSLGGLSFRRVVHAELHTHALVYTAGSRYRLLKAPLGGAFEDITGAVKPGSVRTRGSTGGFSQFIVALDLRPSAQSIAGKIQRLRSQIGKLVAVEAAPLHAELDHLEDAVAAGNFAAAVASAEAFRQRVAARAGLAIPQEWRATRDRDNVAGELLAGTDSLVFSIGHLRDHGD